MKRLLSIALFLLILSGCSHSHIPDSVPQTTWRPPAPLEIDLSEEAQSALRALDLCCSFILEMNEFYPAYAPVLSESDLAYYDRRLRAPDTDISRLSAEITATIVHLRQQVYLHMEETTKLHKSLPDGLEPFIRNFEAELHEIGW